MAVASAGPYALSDSFEFIGAIKISLSIYLSIYLSICKSAPRSRQITTPVPPAQFFYRPDALPAAQPTA